MKIIFKIAIIALALATSFDMLISGASALSINIIGGPYKIFDWESQRCDKNDIPDSPIRVFRDSEDNLVAFASHFNVRRFVGAHLKTLTRECQISRMSVENSEPSQFDDRIWVISTWTEDGVDVYALGHNEFQGHRHPGKCKFSEYEKCWYNSIVALYSRNSGRRFEKVAGEKPVASASLRSEDEQGRPRGFFSPTNMVAFGNYIYTYIYNTGAGKQKRGYCIFRTLRHQVGGRWEYLTIEGWVVSTYDPYTDTSGAPCEAINNLYSIGGVVRHRDSGEFIAVGVMPGGNQQGKFAFSVSSNLLVWSKPRAFLDLPSIYSKEKCSDVVYSYPSLVDERSSSRNLDDVGSRAMLFLTQQKKNRCSGTLNRDLVYFDVEIVK